MNNETQVAQMEAEMIRLRTRGLTPLEISERLPMTPGDISGRLARIAKETRNRNAALADEAYTNQIERLRVLWRDSIQPALDRSAATLTFDKDAVTLAIKHMEREAKLLGLDKGAVKSDEWLKDRTRSDLKEIGEEYARLTGYKFPQGSL